MPLLSKVEAAIAMGISVELLEAFVKKCPKPNAIRKLLAKVVDGELMFEESEIQNFQQFLRDPWPKPPRGTRPTIPKAIADDVRQECHQQCAICGHMDNGELAHIEGVAATLNNSPANLILLCPNHHSKYDLGFKPASNVSEEVVKAAKLLKRNSRVRIMRAEANATKVLQSLISLIAKIEDRLKTTDASSMTATVYVTEAKNLMENVSSLTTSMPKEAEPDADAVTKLLAKKAPTLSKLTSGSFEGKSDAEVRTALVGVVHAGQEAIIQLDEFDCPHCHGRGTTGLVGTFCAFCRGSQVVSGAKLEHYDRDQIDERECPHCLGRGTRGLADDFCAYCHGEQVVSSEDADSYDKEAIDEVTCPCCEGRGLLGLVGDFCPYCRGAQFIASAKARKYDEDDMDLVECPHCLGSGTTGRIGDHCAYCRGSALISKAKADSYDASEIDEVECPHCLGSGTTGRIGDYCAYCGGSAFISKAKADSYDASEIDEVECPRCEGRGETGLSGDTCKLCKGSQVVTRAVARAYRPRDRD